MSVEKCSICGLWFTGKAKLAEHLNNEHQRDGVMRPRPDNPTSIEKAESQFRSKLEPQEENWREKIESEFNEIKTDVEQLQEDFTSLLDEDGNIEISEEKILQIRDAILSEIEKKEKAAKVCGGCRTRFFTNEQYPERCPNCGAEFDYSEVKREGE